MKLRHMLNITVSVVCALVLLALTVFIIVNWSRIPEQLPSNYAFDGTVSGYESKGTLIFQLVFVWFIYVLLTLMGFRPVEKGGALRFTRLKLFRIGRYGGDFTDRAFAVDPYAANNAGIDLLMCLKLTIICLISFLILWSVFERPLPVWFLPVTLSLVFIPVVINLFRIWRISRS